MNMTVMEFAAKYATVEACLEALREVRWVDGPYCPHCGSIEGIYHFKDGRRHKCKECGATFRLITGTIFSDSPIKLLPKWFMAIYLDLTHSKGISSVQLAKDIGVTQKTAWHMLQRIRHAAGNDESTLSGIVEADETFIGGKERNKHASKRLNAGRGTVGKQPVLGLRQRKGGKVAAQPVPDTSRNSIHPPIVATVEAGSRLFSDEHAAYGGLPYAVDKVSHGAGEYVRGEVHTNGIESFWAMVKRCYIGTHHWWSHKHTRRYVDACAFRQNHRETGQQARVKRLLGQGLSVTMPYKTLVGEPA